MSWLITPSQPVPLDPYRSNVSLLLHGDGANGSTTITDNSPTPKTVTAAGNAQISTAQSKFGSSSVRFFGGRLVAPVIDLRSDFTLETWAYADNPSGGVRAVAGNWKNEQLLLVQSGANLELYWFPFSAGSPLITSAGLVAGQWQHLACTRQGTTFRVFISGSVVGTATNSQTASASTASFLVGSYPAADGSSTGPYSGHLDDFRLTVGIARYTANFTPPAAAFPDI